MLDWIGRLFSRRTYPARKLERPTVRPRLESLEDRFLLSATYFVNLATDADGPTGKQKGVNAGDLRYCVNNAASGDTIQFQLNANSSIYLASPLAIQNKNLTIDGTNRDITINGISSGSNACRIFNITGTSKVEIDNLTLASGKAPTTDPNYGGDGGAIYDNAAGLTLIGDTFLQNIASGAGGAIAAVDMTGPLTVTNCAFSFNSSISAGGAIFVASPGQNVSVTNSNFMSNFCNSFGGGAIYSEDGPTSQLTLQKLCLFENNQARGGSGGAIFTTDQFQDSDST